MAREIPLSDHRAKFITGIVSAGVGVLAFGVLVLLEPGSAPDTARDASVKTAPAKPGSDRASRGSKKSGSTKRNAQTKSTGTIQTASRTPHPFGSKFDRIKKTDERKRAFIAALLPLVLEENRRILRERRSAKKRPSVALYKRYRVKEGDRKALLKRIDVIPPSLAVAQAAIESGWGGSRFLREANNLFGERTYKPGAKGIKPREATAFKITKFRTVRRSVRSYMHNLNSNRAYLAFRSARAAARNKSAVPNGFALATFLTRYSELRTIYVERVQKVIRDNDLKKLDYRKFANR